MEELDAPPPAQYVLSALLRGHTSDVRALSHDDASALFSTSRDGTARHWERRGTAEGQSGTWHQTGCFKDHVGFVNAVTTLPGGGELIALTRAKPPRELTALFDLQDSLLEDKML